MRRSKLQANLLVLRALKENGPLRTTHITYDTYLNNKTVTESLDLLLHQKLIQAQDKNRRTFYELTDTGRQEIEIAYRINEHLPLFKVD
jgi:predicted transcriptional regulator